ncbi:unnamed protein product [Adineta ricciae]|uniref:Uncharacterized protein n=1 Tax=Adineta ricciae TaxID=249248 RepID=A0A816ACW7_ADIRI|nr:unnamed protein product [Adineta ricciae]CAF1596437.1 unnamed protein product [Adineta ricciae]
MNRPCIYAILHWATVCLVLLLIPGLIWGGIGALSYLRHRNARNNYVSTACQVVNYAQLEHYCVDCTLFHCTTHRCFDEQILVTYVVNNKSYESYVITKESRIARRKKLQKGVDHDCYYHKKDVGLAIFDLPDHESPLIVMYIITGTICLLIFVIITTFLYVQIQAFTTRNHGGKKQARVDEEDLLYCS